MKYRGIDAITFAICLCCLALMAVNARPWMWPVLAGCALVAAAARFSDARRKAARNHDTMRG